MICLNTVDLVRRRPGFNSPFRNISFALFFFCTFCLWVQRPRARPCKSSLYHLELKNCSDLLSCSTCGVNARRSFALSLCLWRWAQLFVPHFPVPHFPDTIFCYIFCRFAAARLQTSSVCSTALSNRMTHAFAPLSLSGSLLRHFCKPEVRPLARAIQSLVAISIHISQIPYQSASKLLIFDGLTVMISACHNRQSAGDRGSTPRQRGFS